MHDDDNNITICTALYQSSGFFIIMSPAEGLHFSALVVLVFVHDFHCTATMSIPAGLKDATCCNQNHTEWSWREGRTKIWSKY